MGLDPFQFAQGNQGKPSASELRSIGCAVGIIGIITLPGCYPIVLVIGNRQQSIVAEISYRLFHRFQNDSLSDIGSRVLGGFFALLFVPVISLRERIDRSVVSKQVVVGLVVVLPVIVLQALIEIYACVRLIGKASGKIRILFGAVRNSHQIRYRILNKSVEFSKERGKGYFIVENILVVLGGNGERKTDRLTIACFYRRKDLEGRHPPLWHQKTNHRSTQRQSKCQLCLGSISVSSPRRITINNIHLHSRCFSNLDLES
mmetsp:Transcript_13693/g.34437  ORF Transcript_13693/g.34437 Transcript_13693/m.34437 type:complete len:260 (-) Transcript_13693:154-933(-)